jgi:hypothetical protein
MLSTGIKNAILVLLIILILHVLIKNALFESRNRDTKKENFTENQKDTKKHIIPEIVDQKQLDKEDVKPKEETQKEAFTTEKAKICLAPFPTQENDEAELLKFVYGDDKEGDSIGQYFKGLDVTKDVKGKIDEKIACNILKTNDNSLPVSTTCDPGIQKINLDSSNKRVKADCDLNQSIPLMMLKEYEDESSMNGGELYGNLSAYDNMAMNFENYSCGK